MTKKKSNITDILSRIGLPLQTILHLRRFILKEGIYMEFCQSIEIESDIKGSTINYGNLIERGYTESEKDLITKVITYIFLWERHRHFIDWGDYFHKWKNQATLLYNTGRIKRYY